MSERCDRCGSVGEDRRTLWHACFYAMEETGVPFARRAVRGLVVEPAGTQLSTFGVEVPVWGDPDPGQEARDHPFYTLRVCKSCRADWLAAVAAWFRSPRAHPDGDADEREPPAVGSGIFVRRNGATVEVTREEWDRLYADRDKGGGA